MRPRPGATVGWARWCVAAWVGVVLAGCGAPVAAAEPVVPQAASPEAPEALEDPRRSASAWVRSQAGQGPVVTAAALEALAGREPRGVLWVGPPGAGAAPAQAGQAAPTAQSGQIPAAATGGGVVLADVRLHGGWVAAWAGRDVPGRLEQGGARGAAAAPTALETWTGVSLALARGRAGEAVAWDALDAEVRAACRAGVAQASTTLLAGLEEVLLDGLAQRPDAAWKACAQDVLAALVARLDVGVPCTQGDGRCVLWRDGPQAVAAAPGMAAVYADSHARAAAAVLDGALLLGEPAARVRALAALHALLEVARQGDGVGHAVDATGRVVAAGTLQDHAALVLALVRGHAHGGGPRLLEAAARLVRATQPLAREDGTMWGSRAQVGMGPAWTPWLWDGVTPAADAAWLEAQVLASGALEDAPLWQAAHQRAARLAALGQARPQHAATLQRALRVAARPPVVVHAQAGSAGRGAQALADAALRQRLPGVVVVQHPAAPGVRAPQVTPTATAWVCRAGVCSAPTSVPAALQKALTAAASP